MKYLLWINGICKFANVCFQALLWLPGSPTPGMADPLSGEVRIISSRFWTSRDETPFWNLDIFFVMCNTVDKSVLHHISVSVGIHLFWWRASRRESEMQIQKPEWKLASKMPTVWLLLSLNLLFPPLFFLTSCGLPQNLLGSEEPLPRRGRRSVQLFGVVLPKDPSVLPEELRQCGFTSTEWPFLFLFSREPQVSASPLSSPLAYVLHRKQQNGLWSLTSCHRSVKQPERLKGRVLWAAAEIFRCFRLFSSFRLFSLLPMHVLQSSIINNTYHITSLLPS